MAELIHECAHRIASPDGTVQHARIFGERRDGLWVGWIEFAAEHGGKVRTDIETEQVDRDALAYWASGLDAIYLEGALGRAR